MARNGQTLRESLCVSGLEDGVFILVAHHSSAMFAVSGHFSSGGNTFLTCHEGLLGKLALAKTRGRARTMPRAMLWVP